MNYDECCIDIDKSSLYDLTQMTKFDDEIKNAIHEIFNDDMSLSDEDDFKSIEKKNEKSLNQNQDSIKLLNDEINNNKSIKKLNRTLLEEINVDYTLAIAIYELLSSGNKTLDEIRSSICEGLNPEDVDSHHLALKIEMNVERLYMSDYLDYNNQRYELLDSFNDLICEGDE